MLARTMCALSCASATPVSAIAKNASATILGRFFMSRSCCHHWPRLQGWVRGVYNDGQGLYGGEREGSQALKGKSDECCWISCENAWNFCEIFGSEKPALVMC